MKNNLIILSFVLISILPSCTVLRSRYGNGIRIELPETFKRDRSEKQVTSKKKKPKSETSLLSMAEAKDSLFEEKHTDEEVNFNPSDIITFSASQTENRSKKSKNSFYLFGKENNSKKQVVSVHSSEPENRSKKFSTQLKTKKEDGSGILIDLFGDLIVSLLIIIAIIAAGWSILILLLPPAIAEISAVLICIFGLIISSCFL